jgi:hypothetical protein
MKLTMCECDKGWPPIAIGAWDVQYIYISRSVVFCLLKRSNKKCTIGLASSILTADESVKLPNLPKG